jgi:uncharacterized damage-inducible protein DinB
MFRHIRDVETIWRQEAANTLKVLEAIPDAAAHQAVDEQHRDLKRLAWHLCETIAELPLNMGLKVEGFPGEPMHTPPPGSMQEIRDTYAALSESFLATLKPLNDMALAATYPFYGDTWTGAFALWILVSHQTHHRGQMTVLMRQAHLKVPEVCGPVKEAWAAMGMPEPTV